MNPSPEKSGLPLTPNDAWKLFSRIPERSIAGEKSAAIPRVGTKIKGIVGELTDNGAILHFEGGLRGYLHKSEFPRYDWRGERALPPRVGDELEVGVSRVKYRGSKHLILVLESPEISGAFWRSVQVRHPAGSRATGRIAEISPKGIYVAVSPGLVAFVPNSELFWNNSVRAADKLKAGQEIDIVISGLEMKLGRLIASHKGASEDPWKSVDNIYAAGSIAAARVIKVTKIGPLVELGNGCIGLLHASNIPAEHPPVRTGELLRVKILAIDSGQRKMSLSVSAMPVVENDARTLAGSASPDNRATSSRQSCLTEAV